MDPYPPPSSMTLSPQSPPVGQPSTVFRPRRSDDWHEYREIIEQLYRNDQLKLRDVKRIMERDYKFYASEKQYKDRLAAWHVRKNIKAKEVHLMIRKQQKRAARGKQTAFRVNGQNVDPKRIARFVRRYGNSWDQDGDRDAEDQSPEPKTPSDMTCYTPEPEDNAATPVSPPDIQSPTRETSTYPLNYDPNSIDTIPDLIMDDDNNTYPLHIPRRTYHPSHHPHPSHPSAHQLPHPAVSHPLVHPVPHPAITTSQDADHHPPVALPLPGSLQQHRGGMNGPPEMFPHSSSYASLDAFQNRLGELGTTLNESMAKWSREQDPNQEIPHHEGLGL
ncbi:uncharacterized protein N7496_012225 [Penicillium cataractarum]|uniref:Clr5 domain-containing protein n=1 Tax=Penicillium cataractarum TaxID=2100454 RepID=A0A9W9URN4_9EURO|nr:uncharacterized protein N7496_012225 [Penicillium cataractarum]KAJ5355013.1 hypothetical protein N7496_012225 [Penicillium cataractarum]